MSNEFDWKTAKWEVEGSGGVNMGTGEQDFYKVRVGRGLLHMQFERMDANLAHLLAGSRVMYRALSAIRNYCDDAEAVACAAKALAVADGEVSE